MESLFLLILIVVGVFIYLYKFNHSLFLKSRKILVFLLGLGLIAGGIAMYMYAADIGHNVFHPDFAIRNNLSNGGLALGFAGVIILVAYFVVQSLKKSKEIKKDNPAINKAKGAFCPECGGPRMPEDSFCACCGVKCAQNACDQCGGPTSRGDDFCKTCGNAL